MARLGLGTAALGRPGYLNLGHGAELGEEGLLEFTYPQVITIAREAA